MKRKKSWTPRKGKAKRRMTVEKWEQGAIFNSRKFLPELKYFDVTSGGLVINQAAATGGSANSLIFVPIVGADFNARTGRAVQIQSFRMHGFYWATNITTIVELPALLCQALILDRNPNGIAFPQFGDIFLNATTGTTSGTGLTFRNPNTRKRYKTLHYEQALAPQCAFITQAGVGSGTALNTGTGVLNTTVALDSTQKLTFDYYIDARKAKIGPTIFGANNSGVYSDVEENALLLYFWAGCEVSQTYNSSWTAVYNTRVCYTDY